MKNYALALSARSIPYIKELKPIFKTTIGCILGQQLEYWSAKYPDGFFKFLDKPKNQRNDYKDGSSWVEELGVSKEEFRTAFDKFGIRYRSMTDYSAQDNPFVKDGEEFAYCSVHNKRSGQTYYYRNHVKVDHDIESIFCSSVNSDNQSTVNRECQSLEIGNPNLQKSGMPISRDRESQFRYKESTEESKKEITTDTPHTPQGVTVDDRFSDFWSVYPKKVGKAPAQKAWKKLKDAEKQKAIDDVMKRKVMDASWLKKNGQYIPNPSTYINQKRFDDEWNQQPDLFSQATSVNTDPSSITINVSAEPVDNVDTSFTSLMQYVENTDSTDDFDYSAVLNKSMFEEYL